MRSGSQREADGLRPGRENWTMRGRITAGGGKATSALLLVIARIRPSSSQMMVSGSPGPSEREVACTRADAAECARKEGAAAAVTKLCASEENQPAPSPPKAFIASAQAQPAASTAQKKTDHWKGGGTAVLDEPNQRGRGRSDPMQGSRRNSAGQLPAEEGDPPVRPAPGETEVDVELGYQIHQGSVADSACDHVARLRTVVARAEGR